VSANGATGAPAPLHARIAPIAAIASAPPALAASLHSKPFRPPGTIVVANANATTISATRRLCPTWATMMSTAAPSPAVAVKTPMTPSATANAKRVAAAGKRVANTSLSAPAPTRRTSGPPISAALLRPSATAGQGRGLRPVGPASSATISPAAVAAKARPP
jgi:hypothetical protein